VAADLRSSPRAAPRRVDQGLAPHRIGPSEARSHHRTLVLQALYRDRGRSRADLARELGLSRVTISEVVADLLDEQLVIELGTRADSRCAPAANGGTRRQTPYVAVGVVASAKS